MLFHLVQLTALLPLSTLPTTFAACGRKKLGVEESQLATSITLASSLTTLLIGQRSCFGIVVYAVPIGGVPGV